MKRPANIKDSIMMPPPKARPKSRSDTSEELRRNLIETVTNNSENSQLHDEFHKFFKEMEELDGKKYDDELSISKSTSSINFDKLHNGLYFNYCNNNNSNVASNNTNQNNSMLQNCFNCSSCNNNSSNILSKPDTCLSSNSNMTLNMKEVPSSNTNFNFNLVHYDYNYTNISDDEENIESRVSLEKLRKNLTSEGGSVNNLPKLNNNNNLENTFSSILSTKHTHTYKIFKKLPTPANKKEVEYFVNNLTSYMNEHQFDAAIMIIKIKLQTRYNDFKNKGLKKVYFIENLDKMQTELIVRINMINEGDKKIIDGNFDMLNKKRNRLNDASNVSSGISSGSVSKVSSCSNQTPNSSKSTKKRIHKISDRKKKFD